MSRVPFLLNSATDGTLGSSGRSAENCLGRINYKDWVFSWQLIAIAALLIIGGHHMLGNLIGIS